MLLTGGAPRYLQHTVAGGAGDGDMATHELWSPPAKLAGRYLSPYLLEGGRARAMRVHATRTVRMSACAAYEL